MNAGGQGADAFLGYVAAEGADGHLDAGSGCGAEEFVELFEEGMGLLPSLRRYVTDTLPTLVSPIVLPPSRGAGKRGIRPWTPPGDMRTSVRWCA
jgi:hypothetical protein